MKTVICILCLLATVAAGAQQVAPTRVTDVLTAPGLPTTPVPGWTLLATDSPTTLSPSAVTRRGPGVQIHASTPLALFRPGFRLVGDGSVSAVFIVPDTAPAQYGLTLGSAKVFVVHADGAAGIGSLQSGVATDVIWRAPLVPLTAAPGTQQRIEVRVHGTVADLIVNGAVQATTAITASALDGVPGVYVDSGDIVVAGFSVRTAQRIAPGGGGQ